jgi:ribosomal-protein-alanine N-acetyltransferase
MSSWRVIDACAMNHAMTSDVRTRVRRAGPGEPLDGVAALQAESFIRPWSVDAMRGELQQNPVARLFLLEDVAETHAPRLLGFCACWIVAGEVHINSLAIAPAERRQGHARRLLREVFRSAAQEGAHAATLEVRRSNTAAVALYSTLGFAVEGVRRDYYELPREDALILWRHGLADDAGGW